VSKGKTPRKHKETQRNYSPKEGLQVIVTSTINPEGSSTIWWWNLEEERFSIGERYDFIAGAMEDEDGAGGLCDAIHIGKQITGKGQTKGKCYSEY